MLQLHAFYGAPNNYFVTEYADFVPAFSTLLQRGAMLNLILDLSFIKAV